jgi:hypothetical protein
MVKSGKIDWLATVIYPLAVVLMEAFWVFPWLYWLGSWPMYAVPHPPLSLAVVIVVPAVGLAVTRYLHRREDLSLSVIRAAAVGCGIVVFFVALRLDYPPPAGTGWFAHVGDLLAATFQHPSTIVLAAPVLVYLWWRGIVLGRATSYFHDVYRSFALGMAALIVLLIIWQVAGANARFSAPGSDVGMYVIAFFFFGLLSIAVCHLYTIRRSMPKEEAALTSVRRWLPIMLAVIGGMVLIGFGVAALFSPGFFEGVGRVASVVSHGLGKLIDYILIPLGYIFEAVMWVLRWFISLLRRVSPDQEPGEAGNGLPKFDEVTTRDWPPEVLAAIKWLVFIVIIGLVIFLLWRAVSRARARKRQEDIEEINESLFSWAGLRDDLKDMLRNMRNRFATRRGTRPRTYGDDLPGTLDVREIYRRLLRESARSGLPRRPGETVEEYARRLGRFVPESAEPLGGINPAYSEVRYGDRSLGTDRVRGANQLWASLRGVLRKLRGANG